APPAARGSPVETAAAQPGGQWLHRSISSRRSVHRDEDRRAANLPLRRAWRREDRIMIEKAILQAHPYSDLEARSAFSRPARNPIAQHRQEGQAAVDIAYRAALEDIQRALSRGTSVLVECDKALGEYVLAAVEKLLPGMQWLNVTYNEDQPPPPDT